MVVDDEPLAVRLLESFIERTPALTLASSHISPAEALENLSPEIDILFLDVDMPGMTGLELSSFVPASTKIVFTTAYRDYAFDSYAVHAFDYLLKPITFTRFSETIARALSETQSPTADSEPAAAAKSDRDYIFVKCDYRMVRVDVDSILYLKGMGDYVSIFTTHGRAPVTALATMKSLESRLPTDRFCRVHKSYIVNVSHIDAVERNRIMIGHETIPISDACRDRFFSMLG